MTTVSARPLSSYDEAGYIALLDTLFPGKDLGIGFGEQIKVSLAGDADSVVSVDKDGQLTGFIQAEPHLSSAGQDGTTAVIETFVTLPGGGAFGHLVEGLLGQIHAKFNQAVIAVPEDQAEPFTTLGWLVLNPGEGLAWTGDSSTDVRFFEARRGGTTRVAMRLLSHGLHAWSYEQPGKADNERGRHARVQKALAAAQKTQPGFAPAVKNIRVV